MIRCEQDQAQTTGSLPSTSRPISLSTDRHRLGYVMADPPPGGPELVDHVLQFARRIDRYSSGMRYYLDSEDPKARADLVIDNNDLANPVVIEHERPAH